MAHPDGIDYIVRENLDLYLGLEGDIQELADLIYSAMQANLSDLGPGKYAIKAITERGSQRGSPCFRTGTPAQKLKKDRYL